ncbi:MAG: YDG domain-containing protein [Coprococcus sp.]
MTQTPKDAFDSVSVSYESVDKRRSATLVEGKPVNAGDYKATVTVGTGEDAVSASVEYTIQKKEISVYSIDASDKIYDGATKVKVSRVTLIGILKQDVVEADTTDLYGDLPDKNAGTYTEITLPELKLVGDSANNYELTQPDNPMKLNVSVSVQKAPKAPNMPGASMEVDYTKTTVGAVTLPAGWKFDDADIDKKLDVDVPVTVTVKYADEDAGNYEVESVEITLTRKACMHPTIKWIVDKEATVDAEGSRHKECTVCNTVLATETIAKLKAQTPDVTIRYTTHVQTYGWQGDENNANKWFANGKMAGTSGKAKRLEGIKIRVYGNDSLGIQYTTHCQSYGWLPWSANGEMNGTEGEAKRLEAIKIQLTGADKEKYDVYYRVHAQSYGWLAWAANGAPAGTAGLAKRLEAIQIVIVKKGESFDHAIGNIQSARGEAYIASSTANANPVVTGENNVNVEYRTHVQSFGWQGWKYNGMMSGTSGKAKRLEGINIKLTNKPYSGNIVYTTHVQSIGWQGNENNVNTWFRDGQMAGTSGRAKRLEAIRIALTGEMAEHYDVYYRVHAQTYGWLAWAKNGEAAGTAGLSKRLEGIQIVLVPKGGAAPANNYGGVVTTNKQTYIKK